jgi:hypothetical protein
MLTVPCLSRGWKLQQRTLDEYFHEIEASSRSTGKDQRATDGIDSLHDSEDGSSGSEEFFQQSFLACQKTSRDILEV